MPVSLNKLGGQRKLLLSDLHKISMLLRALTLPRSDWWISFPMQSFTRNPSILCAITENNPCVSCNVQNCHLLYYYCTMNITIHIFSSTIVYISELPRIEKLIVKTLVLKSQLILLFSNSHLLCSWIIMLRIHLTILAEKSYVYIITYSFSNRFQTDFKPFIEIHWNDKFTVGLWLTLNPILLFDKFSPLFPPTPNLSQPRYIGFVLLLVFKANWWGMVKLMGYGIEGFDDYMESLSLDWQIELKSVKHHTTGDFFG